MSTRRDVALGLSLLAATVHAWLAPAHFAEAWWLGAGFVAAAMLQTAWTVLLLQHRMLVLPGFVLNLGLSVVWGVSRTVGYEAVGVLDTLTVVAQLALCGVLVGSERARQAGVVVGAALLCVVASGMAH